MYRMYHYYVIEALFKKKTFTAIPVKVIYVFLRCSLTNSSTLSHVFNCIPTKHAIVLDESDLLTKQCH